LKARYGQFGQKYLTFHINTIETAISKGLWEDFSKKLKILHLILNEFFKKHRSVIEAANKLIIDEVQTIDALELNHKMYEVESLEELKSFVLENYILKDLKLLFCRYERILEELAEQQGKAIQFEITGDKIPVDPKDFSGFINISIHLFRNIVDHGIETPEERVEKAKPQFSVVKMNFKKQKNKIEIILEDDGRGIDPKIIKEKAIEVGIKKEEDLKNLDDNSLINLIFLPGFSTRKNVTDISGRGVGMDAVKAKIEELKGTIKLISKIDRGTKYIIEIPLI
jgi:two-component system chemotaxis sensor kinase CheA